MTNSVQPTSGVPVETKGSVARSLAATLVEHRLLDGIAAAVSPAARSMLRDPPLPTFDMYSTRGSFGPPEVVANGRRNRVRFPVTWRATRDR